jgi:hypothetical protein
VEESEWIEVLDWGDTNGPKVATEIENAFEMAQDSLSQFPRDVHCYTVRGADFFIDRGSFVCKSVCVPRAGYTRELQQLIQTEQQEKQESQEPGSNNVAGAGTAQIVDGCIICEEGVDVVVPVSSSAIRKYVSDRDWEGLAATGMVKLDVQRYLEHKSE